MLIEDRGRAAAAKAARAAEAARYFRENAENWGRIRALHVPEAAVEAAMREALGAGPFGLLVDIGTAPAVSSRSSRIASNAASASTRASAMLQVARASLERVGLTNCQVRQGDIEHLPLPSETADVVTVHQVLHFLDEPGRALAEAGRVLKPGGRLLVVDFAPHGLEFLRDEFRHRRLGFSDEQMRGVLAECGLEAQGDRAARARRQRGPARSRALAGGQARPRLKYLDIPEPRQPRSRGGDARLEVEGAGGRSWIARRADAG
ncbi:MAG: class I SAM-dependent methyltransferase [Hyphomicrobiaceae bacterium]